MLIDTHHIEAIPGRLLPVLCYLLSRADGQVPDCDGYITLSFPMQEMIQKLRKTRRAVMGNLRELELTNDVICESVPGHSNRYRVRVRRNENA